MIKKSFNTIYDLEIITRYRRIGYNLNVMRQSACLVFNPIMADNYAILFNCTQVGRASDSMMAPTKVIHFSWLGQELLVCCLARPGSNWCFSFAPGFSKLFGAQGSQSSGSLLNLLSPRF